MCGEAEITRRWEKKLTHRVNLSLNLGFVVSSVIYCVLKFFGLNQFAAPGENWEGLGLDCGRWVKAAKWDVRGGTPWDTPPLLE